MNITISVKEYFEELQLMEGQYGQEEVLYPWIYMLLKMVECKKQQLYGEIYEGVSLKHIPTMPRAAKEIKYIENKIRSILFRKKGVPDIVIIDKHSKSILGCVEMKKISDHIVCQETKANGYSIGELEVSADKVILKYKGQIEDNTINNLFPMDKSGNKCTNKVEVDFTTYSNNKEKIHNIIGMSVKPVGEWKLVCNDSFPLKDRHCVQLMSHLENCPKVLYTNGLVFYFLKKISKDIYVEKLGDLSAFYEAYKKKEYSFDFMQKTNESWEELINNLTKIDWYADPKAPIQQETNNTPTE